MQKIEFVETLNELKEELLSDYLVPFIQEELYKSFSPQQREERRFPVLISSIIRSKSNFESFISKSKKNAEFVDKIPGLSWIYNDDRMNDLIEVFSKSTLSGFLSLPHFGLTFLAVHQSIINTYDLAEIHLLPQEIEKDLEEGVLIFQTASNVNLSLTEYSEIFTTIEELTNAFKKVFGIDENLPENATEVFLLDSGSDNNTGIKTIPDIASAIFVLFKDLMEYLFTYRYKVAEKQQEHLLKSLATRELIQKKVEDGVITEKEGKEYEHLIRTRTNKLLKLNTAPKQLVTQNNTLAGREMMLELRANPLLNEGESDNADSA